MFYTLQSSPHTVLYTQTLTLTRTWQQRKSINLRYSRRIKATAVYESSSPAVFYTH